MRLPLGFLLSLQFLGLCFFGVDLKLGSVIDILVAVREPWSRNFLQSEGTFYGDSTYLLEKDFQLKGH